MYVLNHSDFPYCFNIKRGLYLTDTNQNYIYLTTSHIDPQYKIQTKSIHNVGHETHGQMEGHT